MCSTNKNKWIKLVYSVALCIFCELLKYALKLLKILSIWLYRVLHVTQALMIQSVALWRHTTSTSLAFSADFLWEPWFPPTIQEDMVNECL